MSIEEKIANSRRTRFSNNLGNTGIPCVTSSFQNECVVLVDMIRRQRPDMPVLFLETGYHFPETLAYRDKMTADWNLKLTNLASQAERSGSGIAVRHPEPNQSEAVLPVA